MPAVLPLIENGPSPNSAQRSIHHAARSARRSRLKVIGPARRQDEGTEACSSRLPRPIGWQVGDHARCRAVAIPPPDRRPRQHQELWRIVGPGRHHHFALGPRLYHGTVLDVIDHATARPFSTGDLGGEGVGDDREIGPFHRRIKERARDEWQGRARRRSTR